MKPKMAKPKIVSKTNYERMTGQPTISTNNKRLLTKAVRSKRTDDISSLHNQ